MNETVAGTGSAGRAGHMCFMTLARSAEEARHSRLWIEMLRTFGGRLSKSPVWVFLPDPAVAVTWPDGENIRFVPLALDDDVRGYIFSDKVCACAQAEGMAADQFRSLVWLSSRCLIVSPPDLFDLAPAHHAALRPVHIPNVGSPADESLDDYWGSIYRAIGTEGDALSVESFIESQRLRAYFNTHLFSVDPSAGVMRAWLGYFKMMVSDTAFQSGPCRARDRRIFLHQAILSTLVPKMIDSKQIRILPPEYSYPLHLHGQVPEERRPETLNDLVCPVYEGAFRYPGGLAGIGVRDPLKSWLAKYTAQGDGALPA